MSQTYQVIFYNNSTTSLPTLPGFMAGMGSQVCIYLENTQAPTDTYTFPWVIDNMGFGGPGSHTLQWSDMSIGFVLGQTNVYGGNPFNVFQYLALPPDINVLSLSGNVAPGGWPFYNSIGIGNNGVTGTYTVTQSGGGGAGVGVTVGGQLAFGTDGNCVYGPDFTFWLAVGAFQSGTFIDPAKLSFKTQLSFPPGVFTLYVTLERNNTFTVSQTAPPGLMPGI